MRLKRSGVLGVAAVSAALVLSGCAGSDGTTEPTEAAPTTSTAPETSASPTPKPATSTSPAENIEPPVMPEEAKEFTAEGYEAFVNYWVATFNYGMKTGDTEPLDSVSQEECGVCEGRVESIARIYRDEGWVTGGDIRVEDFGAFMVPDENNYYLAVLDFNQTDGAVNFDSIDDQPISGGVLPVQFFAQYAEGQGWVAAALLEDETAKE